MDYSKPLNEWLDNYRDRATPLPLNKEQKKIINSCFTDKFKAEIVAELNESYESIEDIFENQMDAYLTTLNTLVIESLTNLNNMYTKLTLKENYVKEYRARLYGFIDQEMDKIEWENNKEEREKEEAELSRKEYPKRKKFFDTLATSPKITVNKLSAYNQAKAQMQEAEQALLSKENLKVIKQTLKELQITILEVYIDEEYLEDEGDCCFINSFMGIEIPYEMSLEMRKTSVEKCLKKFQKEYSAYEDKDEPLFFNEILDLIPKGEKIPTERLQAAVDFYKSLPLKLIEKIATKHDGYS